MRAALYEVLKRGMIMGLGSLTALDWFIFGIVLLAIACVGLVVAIAQSALQRRKLRRLMGIREPKKGNKHGERKE